MLNTYTKPRHLNSAKKKKDCICLRAKHSVFPSSQAKKFKPKTTTVICVLFKMQEKYILPLQKVSITGNNLAFQDSQHKKQT